jgi:predicted DNA-binding transcriptional regulator AlpA
MPDIASDDMALDDPALDDDDLFDIDEVCAFFGGTRPLNPSTIYRGAGTIYPRPVKTGPNISRWLKSECVAARRAMIARRGRGL